MCLPEPQAESFSTGADKRHSGDAPASVFIVIQILWEWEAIRVVLTDYFRLSGSPPLRAHVSFVFLPERLAVLHGHARTHARGAAESKQQQQLLLEGVAVTERERERAPTPSSLPPAPPAPAPAPIVDKDAARRSGVSRRPIRNPGTGAQICTPTSLLPPGQFEEDRDVREEPLPLLENRESQRAALCP